MGKDTRGEKRMNDDDSEHDPAGGCGLAIIFCTIAGVLIALGIIGFVLMARIIGGG
jgi:hypothetical protein